MASKKFSWADSIDGVFLWYTVRRQTDDWENSVESHGSVQGLIDLKSHH